ncbi:MAG: hypothetical protein AAGD25_15025 [Cyanobacteria bacterium P01_F01_bin.150]
MLTSQELMDRFGIAKNYALSKRLKPLKDALGVTQLHEKIDIDTTTQWVFKPEYEQIVLDYLETGTLPPLPPILEPSPETPPETALAPAPHLALVEQPLPTDFTSGQITPIAQTVAAHPLVTVEFADLTYDRPQSDTQALERQTLQAKAISANGAAAIQQFLAEDLKAKLVNAMRQNDHLVATAQAGAIASGVESLGKPDPNDQPASA